MPRLRHRRCRPINRESQDIRINQYGVDNSFSTDKHDELRFGKGGVDDAEDAEVILHEYGHAMQDSQQTPFGFGPGGGRRDRRGLRRLLGRHGHERDRADARPGLRRGLGLGLLHVDRSALPAAPRHEPPLPGGPRRRGPRRRRRSGRARCGTSRRPWRRRRASTGSRRRKPSRRRSRHAASSRRLALPARLRVDPMRPRRGGGERDTCPSAARGRGRLSLRGQTAARRLGSDHGSGLAMQQNA